MAIITGKYTSESSYTITLGSMDIGTVYAILVQDLNSDGSSNGFDCVWKSGATSSIYSITKSTSATYSKYNRRIGYFDNKNGDFNTDVGTHLTDASFNKWADGTGVISAWSGGGGTTSYTLTAGSFPEVLSQVKFTDGTSLTSNSQSCAFSAHKYISSISMSSTGSNWTGTIYWGSSLGSTSYTIATVNHGVVTLQKSIEKINFYNGNRTIYFTAVEGTTYTTRAIYLKRDTTSVNYFTVSYEDKYGSTQTDTVASTQTAAVRYNVRDGTNLTITTVGPTTNYDEPNYLIEYESSSYSTEKTRFTVGDMDVRANGTRYIKVFATQQKLYRIHASANGGSFTSGATDYYIPSSSNYKKTGSDSIDFTLSSLPSVSKTGYSLGGWIYKNTVYATTATLTLSASTDGDVHVITAYWVKKLQFTLDMNGGVFADTRSSFRTVTVITGNRFEFKDYSGLAERTGYKLLGWDIDSAATSPTYSITGSFIISESSSTKYYAVWQQTKARITFYGNGGLWGGNLQSRYKDFNVGDTVSFADYSENLTRAGYSLLGWSASSTATTATYGVNGYVTVGATDADYYAVWSKHIDLFYWYGSDTQDAAKIAKGQPVSNLTATIWNSFKKKISEVKIAQTGSDWGYLTVSSGDGITASEVLAARNALAALNNNVPLPTANQLKTGEQILASYFNGTGSLKAALNIIINNYNNS